MCTEVTWATFLRARYNCVRRRSGTGAGAIPRHHRRKHHRGGDRRYCCRRAPSRRARLRARFHLAAAQREFPPCADCTTLYNYSETMPLTISLRKSSDMSPARFVRCAGLRHGDRRARRIALGRAEAAHRHSARAPAPPHGVAAGRGHVGAGPALRARRASRSRPRQRRPHHARRLAQVQITARPHRQICLVNLSKRKYENYLSSMQTVDNRERRPHHLHGPRRYCGARHAQGASGSQR